jgi:hypothetical protein
VGIPDLGELPNERNTDMGAVTGACFAIEPFQWLFFPRRIIRILYASNNISPFRHLMKCSLKKCPTKLKKIQKEGLSIDGGNT